MTSIREQIQAWTDIENPKRFSRNAWIALGILFLLILAPMLVFPLGPDEGLFFVSGEKILRDGAVHYRDMVDVKPPMIYYLNALAILIFGDHAVAIRLLDIILQGATMALMVSLVRRGTGNDLWAAVAAISYALLYVGLNYASTAQTESYVGLLGLGALWLFLYYRRAVGFLLAGFLIGLLFLFKFTLGILLASLAVTELLLFRRSWSKLFIHYIFLGCGFAAAFLLFVAYLAGFDAYEGFQQMQMFLNGYVSLEWGGNALLGHLKEVARNVPAYFNDNYSPLFFIATIIGAVWAVQPPDDDRSTAASKSVILLRSMALSFLLLLVTVIIEGKHMPYQFSRIFPFGAVIGGFGIVWLLRRAALLRTDLYGRLAILMLTIAAVAFSPLNRYLWHGGAVALLALEGPERFDAFYASSRGPTDWTYSEMEELGDSIRARRGPEDRLFVSSGAAGLVYYYSDVIPDFKIYHACFIIADFAPQAWKDSTAAWLLRERPHFIVLQTRGTMETITGNMDTPDMAIYKLPGVSEMLEQEYRETLETPTFLLLERKDR